MSLFDLVFIGMPEIIITFYVINDILNHQLSKKKLIQASFIWLILCFIIKNTMNMGLGTIIIYAITIVLTCIHSDFNFLSSTIAMILYLAMKFFAEIIIIMPINLMGLNLEIILLNPWLKVLIFDVTLILSLLILKMIKNKGFYKTIVYFINERNSSIDKGLTMAISFASIVIIVTIGTMGFILNLEKENYYGINEILKVFIMLSCVMALISAISSIIIANKRKALIEVENSAIRNSLKQMEYSIDALNVQNHDYMNHLQVILMQVTKGRNEDAKKYILSICSNENIDISEYNTGSAYIDAVINMKKRRASKYKIELTACVDSLLEKTELLESELSSILLNIIDNAIDELKANNKEYKYIHVDIYGEENIYNVTIKNNGSKIKDTKKIFEMGYSSKGKSRGYGLYAIKRMLESYNCTIKVISDEEETEFIMEIPISS
ncbi:MAG: GHKL domain-containing protein [Romboutsia sp.]